MIHTTVSKEKEFVDANHGLYPVANTYILLITLISWIRSGSTALPPSRIVSRQVKSQDSLSLALINAVANVGLSIVKVGCNKNSPLSVAVSGIGNRLT